ncbi:hypothetical protein Hdeb2414_s0024g00649531 [Helianthus debilis subsp. tardiflorus]
MVVFKEILPFMKRLPIQKALTDQHKVFKSHVAHFLKNVVYDDVNDVINSSVQIDGENKEIIITEHLVREVLEFPDDENSPTGFPERMVKGCILRMGYDVMKDYQMCMVTALVLNKKYNFSRIVFHYMKDNITSGSRSWVYPRLSKYTKNWPEPKKTEFFGFIKSDKYENPNPVNHLKWRNDTEMKEQSAIVELTKLEDFSKTRNGWYTNEEKKKKGGKRTPKVQTEEGSSSQPQKKRKKKAVETMLVDEPEEDETEANVEKNQEQLSPETEQLMRDIDDTLEVGKSAGKIVGDDEEKSLSGSEDEVDAEVDRWIKENYDPRDRVKQKKRKRSSRDDDDETYIPPENVPVVTSPYSGSRKKSTSRKRVSTPAARRLKFKLKVNQPPKPQNQPSPPPRQPPSPPPR